jgi:hypothetical protein
LSPGNNEEERQVTNVSPDRRWHNLLLEAEAKRVLERLPAQEASALACQALTEGTQSDALIELAGTDEATWGAVLPTWRRALTELKVPLLSEPAARHVLALPKAKASAKAYLAGTHEPRDVLGDLEDLNREYGHPPFLAAFCRLFSEWDWAWQGSDKPALAEIQSRLDGEIAKLMVLDDFDPAAPERQDHGPF